MILVDPHQSRRGFSRIGAFGRCPQLYAHRRFNTMGLRSLGTKATNKGTLIGLGIGHWYARVGAWQGGIALDDSVVREAGLTPEQLAAGVQPSSIPYAVVVTDPALILEPLAAMEAACTDRPELSQFLDMSAHAVARYVEHYQREMDTMRIVAVEVEHETVLGVLDCPGHHEHGKNLIYTARVDFVLMDQNGRITIPDTKTSGAVSSAQAKYYSRHGQFFGLELVGRSTYGDRFDGARLNMVQTDGGRFERPALKPRPWAIGNYRDRLLRREHEIAALEIRTAEYWTERRGLAFAESGSTALSEEQERLAATADLTSYTWDAADHELTCFSRYGLCEFAGSCDWGPSELGALKRETVR